MEADSQTRRATDHADSVHRHTDASPDEVWAVIADGWSYPSWVVGAARMRAVESSWPATGARIHHSAGLWPLVTDDVTTVLDCRPGESIRLQAKGRPLGEATVQITLRPAAGGGTDLEITEDVSRGPSRLVPRVVRQPLITARNTETLRRLALLAERATGPSEREATAGT